MTPAVGNIHHSPHRAINTALSALGDLPLNVHHNPTIILARWT